MGEIIEFPQKNSNEIIFPSKEKPSFRSKLIDALLDIRLTLSIKKLQGPTILKSDFKNLVENTKQNIKEIEVKEALDDVFSQYFDKKDLPNKPLDVNSVEQKIDSETGYEDNGNELGVSKVLSNGHFNSSNNKKDLSDAA